VKGNNVCYVLCFERRIFVGFKERSDERIRLNTYGYQTRLSTS
jgi:hypothetical protein